MSFILGILTVLSICSVVMLRRKSEPVHLSSDAASQRYLNQEAQLRLALALERETARADETPRI